MCSIDGSNSNTNLDQSVGKKKQCHASIVVDILGTFCLKYSNFPFDRGILQCVRIQEKFIYFGDMLKLKELLLSVILKFPFKILIATR